MLKGSLEYFFFEQFWFLTRCTDLSHGQTLQTQLNPGEISEQAKGTLSALLFLPLLGGRLSRMSAAAMRSQERA